MTDELKGEYFDKCRVCLQCRGVMHSLFRERESGAPVETLTKSCGMRISSEDGGPSLICSACLVELDVTQNFLRKCERAQRTLASALTLVEVEVDWETEGADGSSNVEETRAKVQKRVTGDTAKKKRGRKPKLESKKLKVTSTEAELACDTCGRVFKYAGNLRSHQRLHAGDRPFACDMCDKAFSKKDNLIVHRKRHLNKRSYACATCGARHYTAYELRTHERTHTGDKPHACSVCGRRFTASNNLYIHQRTHTGERPHQCSVCGKKFISNNILSIHKRTHTGEKPYVCPICGKRFASNKLAAHARTHTGEKRHVCTLCGRQFASPNVLKIHMRRHTGEKPYRCTACGQLYAHKQSLNKHKRRRHLSSPQRPPPYSQESITEDSHLRTDIAERLTGKPDHDKLGEKISIATVNISLGS